MVPTEGLCAITGWWGSLVLFCDFIGADGILVLKFIILLLCGITWFYVVERTMNSQHIEVAVWRWDW